MNLTPKVLLVLLLSPFANWGQYTVSGFFKAQASKEIRLKGFDSFNEKLISEGTTNEKGEFSLSYPQDYRGMGIIEIREGGSMLVILSKENFSIEMDDIRELEGLRFINSEENKLFDQYVRSQGTRSAKLDGLKYIKPLYAKTDSGSSRYQFIVNEITRLEQEENLYIDKIPKDKYASFYLPLRKLIQERPASITRYFERIPQHISDFEAIDLTSKELAASGLTTELLQGHFKMLSSYGQGADGVLKLYNESTDKILDKLLGYDKEVLAISEFLFKDFEKTSMLKAAEHLSLVMLEQNSCTVEGELKKRFEQYREMKVGKKAPNISLAFEEGAVKQGFLPQEQKLYDITSKYKLVVFWASTCPHCMEEMPKLEKIYPELKQGGFEVLAVSIDKEQPGYTKTIANYPWKNYCDFKGWQSPRAQDFYVFSTPGMYLLDENNTIILKPKSMDQVKSYLHYVVQQG